MTFVGLKRTVVGEIMDSPTLDRAEHVRALEGLRRINAASGTVRGMVRPILGWARREAVKEIRMLDVACGGGDVPIGVARGIARAGLNVHLTLTDRSEVALAQASAAGRGLDIATVQGDAVAGLPREEFDVVTNSLFLHHLERGEVVRVLRNMRDVVKVRGIIVISDLQRSRAGWLLACVACRVLTRSPVVHFDGPMSVRAAWTLEELRGMAREAGLGDARVERAWPWRMMLVWERGGGA